MPLPDPTRRLAPHRHKMTNDTKRSEFPLVSGALLIHGDILGRDGCRQIAISFRTICSR
jgi:hypothetical protein